MGYLHTGHLSLVDASRRDGCWTVVSIFVNPTQFGPHEDFDRYPRDEARDLKLCEDAGVELVFIPDTSAMYAPNSATTVHVAKLTEHLCGPHRPGHFEGVATVVAKLFNIVQPDRAYFGRKDAQQLAIIEHMVRDLDMPLAIVGCDTVREPDGLAMSSRNVNLTPEARARALALHRALQAAHAAIGSGERDARAIEHQMSAIVAAAAPSKVDYISVVDGESLQPVERIEHAVLIALAVRFGGVRLIDNIRVDPAAMRP